MPSKSSSNPSTSKAKGTKVPPQKNDPLRPSKSFQGFRSINEKERLEIHFINRPVIVERAVNIDSFKDLIGPNIKERGWHVFLTKVDTDKGKRNCNVSLVREFYASFRRDRCADPYHYVAYVRGRIVEVNPDSLYTVLGIPHNAQAPVPWVKDSDWPAANTIATALLGRRSGCVGDKLDHGDLTEYYRALNLIVVNAIILTNHKAILRLDQAGYLYALGTCTPIDLARLFILYMAHNSLSKRSYSSLSYGWLVTRLCAAAGCAIKPGDIRKQSLGVLTASAMKKSDAHLLRREPVLPVEGEGEDGSEPEAERAGIPTSPDSRARKKARIDKTSVLTPPPPLQEHLSIIACMAGISEERFARLERGVDQICQTQGILMQNHTEIRQQLTEIKEQQQRMGEKQIQQDEMLKEIHNGMVRLLDEFVVCTARAVRASQTPTKGPVAPQDPAVAHDPVQDPAQER